MTRALQVPQFKLKGHGLARFFGSLEARIMSIMWDYDVVTVQDVCNRLGKDANYKTVMTVMNRLAEKGVLERTKISRAFAYRARVSRQEFMSSVSHQIVSGLLSEFGELAVAQFVDVLDELDPEALETLQRLIKEHEKARLNSSTGRARE